MRLPALGLDVLIAVVVTAERGGIGPAARELGLTPSAVDKRIRTAVQALGAKIFKRDEGGLLLTDAGRLFVDPASKAVEYAILAEERTKAHVLIHRRSILLGHSPYLAPRLLGLIRRLSIPASPGLRIEHRTGLTNTLIERVLDGELDAALGRFPVQQAALIEYKVFEEPVVVCLPADHRLARRHTLSPTDLNGEPVVAVAREPSPALHHELEEYFDGFSINLRVVEDAFSPSEALTLVEQKAGICFLAKSSAFPRPGVEVKPLSAPVLTRKTGLMVREDNREGAVAVLTSLILEQMEPLRLPRRNRA